MSRPRYSIIPADAVDVLSDAPLKVLLIIGTHTNNLGWCLVNQRKIAERIGVSRETVNRAVNKLCALGFLEKHDRRDKGQNICSYRVVMDRGLPEPELVETDDGENEADLVTPTSQGGVMSGSQDYPPCDLNDVTTPCDVNDVTTQRPLDTTISKKHSSLRSECQQAAAAHAAGEPKSQDEERKPTRLPNDWQLTPDWQDWTLGEFAVTRAEIANVAASFRDFWIAKPGAQAKKLDWLATWRNWCRKEFARKRRAVAEPVAPVLGADLERQKWEQRLKIYAERGLWPRETWGPAPGEAGCQIPGDMLRAHGLPVVALVA